VEKGRGNRIPHRAHIDAARVDQNDVRLLARRQRPDAIIKTQHARTVANGARHPMRLNSIRSKTSGPVCANKLAISVFDTYEQIVEACCQAWNFFANNPKAICTVASREYAKMVNP